LLHLTAELSAGFPWLITISRLLHVRLL